MLVDLQEKVELKRWRNLPDKETISCGDVFSFDFRKLRYCRLEASSEVLTDQLGKWRAHV